LLNRELNVPPKKEKKSKIGDNYIQLRYQQNLSGMWTHTLHNPACVLKLRR
jgi:hypothetical protein